MRQLAGRNMAIIAFLILYLSVDLSVGANPPPGAEKAKTRLEELFLWKVSDTLELTTNEEEQFRNNFRKLTEKKLKASQDMDRLMVEIEKNTNQKTLSKTLGEYNKRLAAYNGVQVEEAQIMRKILGDKKFAQYLILKRDLNQKLKTMLSSPSRE